MRHSINLLLHAFDKRVEELTCKEAKGALSDSKRKKKIVPAHDDITEM
jgi:hypothetical protein